MSTLATAFTLQNTIVETDENGDLIEIFDNMSKTNKLMEILPWFPTNRALHHLTGEETSFGTPTPVVANEGGTEIINEVEQIIDVPITYHNVITPDPLALEGINDIGEWRARQIKRYAKGYSEDIAEQIISGDSLVTPGKSIDGLAKRFNSLPTSATDVTDPFYTVQSAGGVGADNRSIYVLGLGMDGVYGLYAKNGIGGFHWELKPAQYVTAAGGSGKIWTEPIDLSWKVGLCASNRRAAGRLCNIDFSDLTDDASAGANLVNELIHLINKTKVFEGGLTPVLLADNDVISYFEAQRVNKTINHVGLTEDLGMALTTFKGIPFIRMDAMATNEALVS
jgi:hypothetical protein